MSGPFAAALIAEFGCGGGDLGVALRPFQREEFDSLPDGANLFISSLVIHHRHMRVRLRSTLSSTGGIPGGALLIADLVLPTAPGGQRALGKNWDEVARE